jgi:hypothetical protein
MTDTSGKVAIVTGASGGIVKGAAGNPGAMVVLNCCVTDTKDTPCWSNSSTWRSQPAGVRQRGIEQPRH